MDFNSFLKTIWTFKFKEALETRDMKKLQKLKNPQADEHIGCVLYCYS